MKSFLMIIMGVLAWLIGIAIGLSLEALIYWGIGNLILWLLNIQFDWTFMYGLSVAIVIVMMKIEFGIGE